MYDLTKFTKTFEDLINDEDRRLYLLKHAGSAENLPDFNDDVIAKAINRLLVNKNCPSRRRTKKGSRNGSST